MIRESIKLSIGEPALRIVPPANPAFVDWMAARFPSSWVVARRSPRILAKYGPDVACLSPQRMRALQAEYDALYSADAAASVMLAALRAIRKITDGSQPIDAPGAAMVAAHAIAKAEAAGIRCAP